MLKECKMCKKDKSIFTMDIITGFCLDCKQMSIMNKNDVLSKEEVEDFKKKSIERGSKKGNRTNYVFLRLGGFFIFISGIIQLILSFIPIRFNVLWSVRISLILLILGGLWISLVKDRD